MRLNGRAARSAERVSANSARVLSIPHPGVDDRQAVAVLQDPHVDVVELEGQR